MLRGTVTAAVCAAAAGLACGQSLYEQTPTGPSGRDGGDPAPAADGAPSLEQVSLTYVSPPKPRTFAAQDLITIIVSERTSSERSASLETEKDYSIDGTVTSTVDLLKLLELRLQQGRDQNDDLPTVSGGIGTEFEGEAEYERDDSVTARVTARVLEVKPNGTLLLEARTTVRTDFEQQTITLSGVCRSEDVTATNTVQSNQMFDLRVDIQNEGEVRKGGEKGLIPRVLDTLFAF